MLLSPTILPHSCEVTGTNNCIMYIRRGPNNHDLKTTNTRTIPSAHCRTLASEGAIGRLARSPTDDVMDVPTPQAQLSEKHEYIKRTTLPQLQSFVVFFGRDEAFLRDVEAVQQEEHSTRYP